MKISSSGSSKSPDHLSYKVSLRLWIIGLSGLVLLMLAVLGIFSFKPAVLFFSHLSEYIQPRVALYQTAADYGFGLYRKDMPYVEAIKRVPERMLRSVDIPSLVIDIKFKHMQHLVQKREAALKRGLLVTEEDDFVPATIRYKARTVDAEVRLKGDFVDHLEGEKWSFRVHTKGANQLFGLRRFSLQHPKARGFQGEILYFETLKLFKILVPQYFFLNLTINGKDIGLMAVEEHFSKELLERQGRREGVIIRFNESLAWQARDGDIAGISGGAFDNYKNASIDAFQDSKIQGNATLREQYGLAVGLLRGFVENTLPVADVFDVEQFGHFLAVTHFWGAWHPLRWHNLRFYFNPLTLRLEPIASDAELQYRSPVGNQGGGIVDKLLSDKSVRTTYLHALKMLSVQIQDHSLIDHLKKIEQPHLDILQTEFVLLETFDENELRLRANQSISLYASFQNQRITTPYIDSTLYPQFLHAYLVEDNGSSYLEIGNAIPHPVSVHEIRWIDNNDKSIPFEPDTVLTYPLTLIPTDIGALPHFYHISYRPPPYSFKLVLTASIGDQDERISHTILPYFKPSTRSPLPVSDIATQLHRHPYLHLESTDSTFVINPGTWNVRQSIILPVGYRLHISAGTTLRFADDAMLFINGAVTAQGTDKQPIVLEGLSENVSHQGLWPGVVIMKAGQSSHWTHVTIRNTVGLIVKGWGLTGGVSFYRSDVNMIHCTFTGNKAEDALNIIHSKFELRDTSILNTASDGFDVDFSTGLVSGGLFQDLGQIGGGDGIDISGSDVTIEGTKFLRISDKALSVGEESRMIVRNVTIEDAVTGAVSKDNSTLELYDSTFINSQFAAIMAYSKKPEYGPGYVVATNVTIQGNSPAARVQHGSRIVLDGQEVPTEPLDVDRLYDTIMKKGPR